MSPRALALAMSLSCLVLLGATVADWAVVDADRRIEVDDAAAADGSPDDEGTAITIEGETTTSGVEVAGGLLVVGLTGLLVAGLTARAPALGAVQVPLGALAAIQAGRGLAGLDGATAAPGVALLAGAVLVATGAEAARIAWAGPERRPARPQEPSRYTVEAARGETETADDEWDMAVADEQGGRDGDGATG